MALHLAKENIWIEKTRFNNAERKYYENLSTLLKETIKGSDEALKNCVVNAEIHQETIFDVQNNEPKKQCGKISSNRNYLKNKNTESQTQNKKIYFKEGNQNKFTNTESNYKKVGTQFFNTEEEKNKVGSTFSTSVAGDFFNNVPIENLGSLVINLKKNKTSKYKGSAANSQCTLVSEIAKAREHIKNSLEKMDGIATLAASPATSEVLERLDILEKNNKELYKLVQNLNCLCLESQKRITTMEAQLKNVVPVTTQKSEPKDCDVDLFASDSDEDNLESLRIREERVAAYAAKKSKKPALIAKSSLVLDVKPWDDETDLKVMEQELRKITCNGLLWGASKFVPVAFGIQKLSISCVVEDEQVSIDWLTEEIEKLEDYVQSVDVAAFNKI